MPDFVSIDVEGFEIEVLKTLDFTGHRPYCFCIETAGYESDTHHYKESSAIDFMKARGYEVYADTYINTIFFDPEQSRVNHSVPSQ